MDRLLEVFLNDELAKGRKRFGDTILKNIERPE